MYNILSWKGTTNRSAFFLHLLLSIITIGTIGYFGARIIRSTNSGSVFLFFCFYLISTTFIKRLRDLGSSTWWIILIPIAFFSAELIKLLINIFSFDLDRYLFLNFPNKMIRAPETVYFYLKAPFILPFWALFLTLLIAKGKENHNHVEINSSSDAIEKTESRLYCEQAKCAPNKNKTHKYKYFIISNVIFLILLSVFSYESMHMMRIMPAIYIIGVTVSIIGLIKSFNQKMDKHNQYIYGGIITTASIYVIYEIIGSNYFLYATIINSLLLLTFYIFRNHIISISLENPKNRPKSGGFEEFSIQRGQENSPIKNAKDKAYSKKYYGIFLMITAWTLFSVLFSINFLSLMMINRYSHDGALYKTLSLSVFLMAFISLGYIYIKGKKISKHPANIALSKDTRSHILWLRSFSFDLLKTKSLFNSFGFISLFRSIFGSTFEEVIVDVLSKIGPVIALGNVNGLETPLGAYRVTTNDQDWVGVVHKYARTSKYIVIIINSTPSLLWEIEELPKIYDDTKFIYLLPPHSSHKSIHFESTWAQVLGSDNHIPKIDYNKIEASNIIGFYIDRDHTAHEIKSSGKSDRSYIATLSFFINHHMTKFDIEAEKVRRSSPKSWKFPVFLLMSLFTTAGTLIIQEGIAYNDSLITSIVNVGLILLGFFYIIKCIWSPKVIISMFKEHIVTGITMNIIVVLIIILPFFWH